MSAYLLEVASSCQLFRSVFKTTSVSQIHKLRLASVELNQLVSTPNTYNVNLVNLDVSLKEKLAHFNCQMVFPFLNLQIVF